MFLLVWFLVAQQIKVSSLTYVVVAMRVVGLEGFLTYEHDSGTVMGIRVVTRCGGMVWGGQGVVGIGVVVGHTVLLDSNRRLRHGMGMVCVWGVVVLLLSLRPSWAGMGLGCRRSRARRLSH